LVVEHAIHGGQRDQEAGVDDPPPVGLGSLCFWASVVQAEPPREGSRGHQGRLNDGSVDGKMHGVFVKEIKLAKREYVKRVQAHVRVDQEFWESTLKECESQSW
jgi:hypothetical protein